MLLEIRSRAGMWNRPPHLKRRLHSLRWARTHDSTVQSGRLLPLRCILVQVRVLQKKFNRISSLIFWRSVTTWCVTASHIRLNLHVGISKWLEGKIIPGCPRASFALDLNREFGLGLDSHRRKKACPDIVSEIPSQRRNMFSASSAASELRKQRRNGGCQKLSPANDSSS